MQPGDVVSAAAYSWGVAFAKAQGDRSGRSDNVRVEGKVVEADGRNWVVDFNDDENISWKRSELKFVSRPGATAEPVQGSRSSQPQERQDSSDEEEAAETEQQHEGDGCLSDSSDVDETAEAEPGRVGRPNHGGAAVQAGAWMRDDNYAVDERSKSGFAAQPAPQIAIVV